MAAELPPLENENWPSDVSDLRLGFAGRLNIYRVMAHHPELLRAWAAHRDHLVLANALGPRLTETIVLRIAARLGSDYEWAHHTVRGRQSGLPDELISAISRTPDELTGQEALIVGAVDQLIGQYRLDEDTKRELWRLIGPKGILDLMALVGMYSTLAFIGSSFSVEIDKDIAAELESNPLDVLPRG